MLSDSCPRLSHVFPRLTDWFSRKYVLCPRKGQPPHYFQCCLRVFRVTDWLYSSILSARSRGSGCPYSLCGADDLLFSSLGRMETTGQGDMANWNISRKYAMKVVSIKG